MKNNLEFETHQSISRILSRSPVLIFIWSNAPNWPVVFVSGNVEDLIGYTPDDLISRRVDYEQIIHPDDVDRVRDELICFANDKAKMLVAHSPYRLITKDGRVRWFDDRTTIIRDARGDVIHFEGVLMDITDRRRSEELLSSSELKFRKLSESIPGMIYSARSDWTVSYITNPELVCGFSSDDFLEGRVNWFDLIHPDDKEMVASNSPGFFVKPTSLTLEYRILSNDGTYRFVADHKTSRFSGSMAYDGVDGIVFDISDRVKFQQELVIAKDLAEKNELELKERVKELQGIFKLGLLQDKFDSLDDILNEFVMKVVPKSMHFSHCVYAQVTINGVKYANISNFSLPSSQNVLTAPITVFKLPAGQLLVAYTNQSEFDDIYEQNLIDTYAQRLSTIVEKVLVQKQLKQQNEEYSMLNDKLMTAFKRVEESERRFKDIFGFTKDSMVIVDMSYRIIMSNRSACKLFGYLNSESLNFTLKSLFGNYPRDHEDISKILTGQSSIANDIQMRRKDGSVFYADFTATPLSLEGQSYFLCSMRDITAQKQLQHQIVRTIIETEEKERKRVAQELHDGLGPILSTVKLFTETYFSSTNNDYKKQISQQLMLCINEALDQVSIISNNLSPQILEDFGLRIALKNFIDKLTKATSYLVSFKSNIDKRLSSEVEITLYRIVIELINNTIKHAGATSISVSIIVVDSFVMLDYADDGVGFDPLLAFEQISGMGLFNIHHRVSSLNGEFEFPQSVTKGMRLKVKIPINSGAIYGKNA